MNKNYRKLLFPIIGLISLIIMTILAFKYRLGALLIIVSLLLLPVYIVIALRLLTRISTFISVQLAFGLALSTFYPFIILIDLRSGYDQMAIMELFVIPFFAIYSLISLIYMIIKEKYNLFKAIVLFGLILVVIIITFNRWYSSDWTYMLAILLIYIWVSLISIIYLAFRRNNSFGKSIIPLVINLVSIAVIWTITIQIQPLEIYYRYYWRQDGFNVIVQHIETGKLQPDNSNGPNIHLSDFYRPLAYDGWVEAVKAYDGWSILFYDSPMSGYLYREDGTVPIKCDDVGSDTRRIDANWFYCHP